MTLHAARLRILISILEEKMGMEAPCLGLLKCSQPGATRAASTGPAEERRGVKGPTSKICSHRSGIGSDKEITSSKNMYPSL